jgi:hypothetical protein
MPVNPANNSAAERTITIPAAKFAELQEMAAKLERTQAEKAAAERAAAERTVDGVTSALAETRARLAESEARAKRLAVSSELQNAIAGLDLAPHAGPQLLALLSPEFRAEPTPDGGFRVQSANGEPAATLVARKLQDPSWRHFLAANRQPESAPATVAPPKQIVPKNMGEAAVVAVAQDRQTRRAAVAAIDPRRNMSVPFGIGKSK